jgi:dTDP-glucose pyrophosphorylase
VKQAVILAAGEGRRLKPFTVNKPKVMLSIAGKPIIHYVIEALTANGIRDIVMVVGYQKEQIFDYIGDGKQFGADITFITQSKQLGTAQALYQAKNSISDEILVLSGNRLITPATIAQFVHQSSPSILIKKVDDPSRYGVVSFVDGKISGIVEKPLRAESDFISTGIFVFHKQLFNYFEEELSIPTAIDKMISNGITVNTFELDNFAQYAVQSKRKY